MKAKDKQKNITTKEESKITYTKSRFRVTLFRWKKGWTTPKYLSIFIADNIVIEIMVKNTVACPRENLNQQFPVPLISSSKLKVNNELPIAPTPRSIHDWTRIRKVNTLLLNWDEFQKVRIVIELRHNVERVSNALNTQAKTWLMKCLRDGKRRISWNSSWKVLQTIWNLWIYRVRFISSALIFTQKVRCSFNENIVPFIAWVAAVYVCGQYHAIHRVCYNGYVC